MAREIPEVPKLGDKMRKSSRVCQENLQSLSGWWFGCHFLFSHIVGMSSSQLTFIFFRGVAQPPTSYSLYQSFTFGDFPVPDLTFFLGQSSAWASRSKMLLPGDLKPPTQLWSCAENMPTTCPKWTYPRPMIQGQKSSSNPSCQESGAFSGSWKMTWLLDTPCHSMSGFRILVVHQSSRHHHIGAALNLLIFHCHSIASSRNLSLP